MDGQAVSRYRRGYSVPWELQYSDIPVTWKAYKNAQAVAAKLSQQAQGFHEVVEVTGVKYGKVIGLTQISPAPALSKPYKPATAKNRTPERSSARRTKY